MHLFLKNKAIKSNYLKKRVKDIITKIINLLSKSSPSKLILLFTALIICKPSSIEIMQILKFPLPKLKNTILLIFEIFY